MSGMQRGRIATLPSVPMKLNADDMQVLQTLKETLVLPCECPGEPLGHENVPRQKNGDPELPVLHFLPECKVQHFACPHFLRQEKEVNKTVRKALEILGFGHKMTQLNNLGWKAIRMDSAVRKARTECLHEEELGFRKIPDRATATVNAADKVEEYIRLVNNELNPLRLLLLEATNKALETGEV